MHGWKYAVAAALTLSMATFGLAFHRHISAGPDISAARQVKLFGTVTKPPFAQVQRWLLATPLQPDLVHGLVAQRVSKRRAKVLSKAERQALESLGWRSTVVQLDLIQDGIARNDERVVLTRIDGLLRRGKQKRPLLDVLFRIEQTGDYARGKLVNMLSANPPWRRDFLTAAAGIAGKDAVLARAATLDAMFARRLFPRREEVAPIVNTLEATDGGQRAETLWRKFHKIDRAAPLPFDPTFIALAANQLDDQYQAMAYEWRAGQGSGFSVRATMVGVNSAVLNLRWNGRGAPVFLRQRLITQPGRFAVIVKGSLLDRNALQRVAFVFYCNGKPPVFHDRLSQGTNGTLIFNSSETVNCRNPEIRLVGMPQEGSSPVEFEFTSIRVAIATATDVIAWTTPAQA